ncbi:TPA: hypothetical protein ENS27_03410, partial [bacterium]|nr:hypothetical protein [bacterium]
MPLCLNKTITLIIIFLLFFSFQVVLAKPMPEIITQDYTLWGKIHLKDPDLPYDYTLTSKDTGYNITVCINNLVVSSYTMGSNPNNEDFYVLKIPIGKSIKTGDQAHIKVNEFNINNAYQEPEHQPVNLPLLIGNPFETKRIDFVILVDKTPPYIANHNPSPDSIASRNTSIYLEILDKGAGVDQNKIIMTVEGNVITPVIEPVSNGYSITYQPIEIFSDNQQVDVTIYAVDLSPFANEISPLHTYRFVAKNNAPIAKNLLLTPQHPRTNDELLCSYEYSDIDGDIESGSEIKWYKDEVYQSYYKNKTRVSPTSTIKGQTWYFTVRPRDGIGFGEIYKSESVVIQNSPPTAKDVRIVPTSPTSSVSISCNYDYDDPDNDAEVNSELHWYKNGILQEQYDNKREIESSSTTKGDNWHFTIKPYDGIDYGELLTSSIVTILNSPPEATNAHIEPVEPIAGEELLCLYDYQDSDGDIEIGTTIRWYKNENMQSKYNDEKFIPREVTILGDSWHFVVRVKDGTEEGKYQRSETVLIGNGLPIVSNVRIELVTDGSLLAMYDYRDRESENGTELRWYRDGVVQEQYNDQKIVTDTNKGERWYFTVRPKDGVDFGRLEVSPKITIGNIAPIASKLEIIPKEPLTTDSLTCNYSYSDANGDLENGTEIKWYKNNIIQEKYNNNNIILPSETHKGEKWHFTIRPQDGINFGEMQKSPLVTISNSLPKATNLIINPSKPLTADELICSYIYSDADEDTENGTEINWYKDDVYQSNYKNKLKISANSTQKGQIWYFTVKPKDGEDFGELKKSKPIEIGNTPPIANDLSIKPSIAMPDDDLICHYEYTDIDDDIEEDTEIIWYKNGFMQEKYNNQLKIPSFETNKGEIWYFTIKPYDGFDYGDLQKSPSIKIGNTPPEVSNIYINPSNPLAGEELTCFYDYYDIDDDTEDGTVIRWYKNGNLQSIYNDTKTIQAGITTSGDNWYVLVIVSDGVEQGKQQKSETVTISNILPIAENLDIKLASNGDIIASYDYIDNEKEEGTEIRWYKNDDIQEKYNNHLIIPSLEKKKGDKWYFTIRPKDGIDFGEIQTSKSLTIGNIVPVANNLIILPKEPFTTDKLTCNYDYDDMDNDAEVNSEL